jgi:hypothetical protein
VRQLDGQNVRTFADVSALLRRRAPGDTIVVVFADRSGASRTSKITLAEDPAMEIVPIEAAGGTLTEAQRAFRQGWLN